MAKKATPSRELTLDALRGFHSGTKIELSNLEQMKDYIEDVLGSLNYIKGIKGLPKESLQTFKAVEAEALKIKGALPCIIAWQKVFVKCCGSIIEDSQKYKSFETIYKEDAPTKRKGRSPSSRASRATTSKTTKKSTTKKPTKGRAK